MAGGYQVGIASETKAFKQGVEAGVIEPLEDAQKELLELGKSRGPEQLERSMKDAEKATERLADETEDTARAIEREYKDAYRKMKNSSEDGTDAAKEGFDELKDEANSTAREAAASFDGSAESIADAFQEVAANAFAGFGPAGAIAGLAAAAGIGLAVAGFESIGEAEEASRERASEWAAAYVEAGSKILTSTITVAKQQDIATDPEKFKTATENAKNWGVDVSVAMAAMAGEAWALEAANDALTASEEKAAAEAVKLADGGEALADMLVGTSAQARAGRDALDQLHNEMEAGGAQFDALSDSLLKTISNSDNLSVAVDELGNKVVTLPDGAEIFIDAKTGKASADVSRFKEDADGVIDHLNGRDILLQVKANMRAARDEVTRFIASNDGKSFKLHGRVQVDNGWG